MFCINDTIYCFLITYLLLNKINFARSRICLSEVSKPRPLSKQLSKLRPLSTQHSKLQLLSTGCSKLQPLNSMRHSNSRLMMKLRVWLMSSSSRQLHKQLLRWLSQLPLSRFRQMQISIFKAVSLLKLNASRNASTVIILVRLIVGFVFV
jgi:hypothetical protein